MSQASMNKLAADMEALRIGIPSAANELKKDAVLTLENGLTQTTPIDTGAAISNWLVSIDAPRVDIIEPYAPSELGKHNHHTRGTVDGAPLNAAGAMDAARGVVAEVAPGQPLFISNNDPAVFETDSGNTKMREEQHLLPGYVGRSILSSVSTMSRATLKV